MSQGSVYDLMHKRGKLFTGRELLSVINQTAVGMNYLHSFRPPVLHRDLKVERKRERKKESERER